MKVQERLTERMSSQFSRVNGNCQEQDHIGPDGRLCFSPFTRLGKAAEAVGTVSFSMVPEATSESVCTGAKLFRGSLTVQSQQVVHTSNWTFGGSGEWCRPLASRGSERQR